MLKKTITYTDFNGNEVTEEFMFNLTKAELVEKEFSQKVTLSDAIMAACKSNDHTVLVPFAKDLILSSYGKISDDGRRFIKSKEMATEFYQTQAYSDLAIDLMSDDKNALAFIKGIMPSDMASNIPNDLKAIEKMGLEVVGE